MKNDSLEAECGDENAMEDEIVDDGRSWLVDGRSWRKDITVTVHSFQLDLTFSASTKNGCCHIFNHGNWKAQTDPSIRSCSHFTYYRTRYALRLRCGIEPDGNG
jgi:phage tail tube protein FII